MSVYPSEGGMTGTQSSWDLNACCRFTTVGEGRWLLRHEVLGMVTPKNNLPDDLVASRIKLVSAGRPNLWCTSLTHDLFSCCSGKHSLPHQAGIELSDFHARVWKSDQGGRNAWKSDQVHGIPTNKRKQQFLNFHLLPRKQF